MKVKNSVSWYKWPALLLAGLAISCAPGKKSGSFWKSSEAAVRDMESVRKKIIPPRFPDREHIITAYGAVGDGQTLNTVSFKKAIEDCSSSGGGRVVVPSGVFLTGAIYLKSNVDLHLSEGSVVLFSRDTKDYPLVFTHWEGMECMNYSPFIYAYGEENIAITGKGLLDGNADKKNWWIWKGQWQHGWKEGMPEQSRDRKALYAMMQQKTDPRTRIFGEGHFLRPNLVQPFNCKNVLISGVKMINSPMWFINPVLCENVTIEGVTVASHGPNNDGCDPESCKNVLIKDCYFDTGDDCIAIKSGRDEDGRRIAQPAENHIIEGCVMKDGHGGVVIGSEIAGGARNIFAVNCRMDSKNLDRILRIKTSSSRGGIIENVFMKDIQAGAYRDAAVRFNMFYEMPGNFIPVIRNIWVENLDVEHGGQYGIYSRAYEQSPVENVRFVNCTIRGVKKPIDIDYMKNVQLHNVIINGQPAVIPSSTTGPEVPAEK